MKLSFELVAEVLEEQFGATLCTLQSPTPEVGLPLFLTENRSPAPGELYISAESRDALCRSGVCTIYARGAHPARRGGSFVCTDASLEALFNGVNAIFERFEGWETSLEQVLLRRGDLRELMNAAQRLLNNPIALVNEDFSPVEQVGLAEMPPNLRLFESEPESIALINALRQDAFYNQALENYAAFPCPAHLLGLKTLNVNILRDGGVSHRLILIESRRAITGGDAFLLSRLAEFVDCHLKQERPDLQIDNRLRAILQRVLSDRTADYVDMSRQLQQLNWLSEDEYFCVVFRPVQDSLKSTTPDQICDYLKKQYFYACGCRHDGLVVVFFDASRIAKPLDDIADELKYFIREGLLHAGYSRAMTGHGNLRRQYLQARAALETGSRINPFFWIHHFDSVSLRFLLEESTRRLPPEMLCHEGLMRLRATDAAQDSEYMKTLRVYLDNSMNAVASARALFIHRSTLLYRLSRIREILGSPLEDADEILYLSLSFRLLELETSGKIEA